MAIAGRGAQLQSAWQVHHGWTSLYGQLRAGDLNRDEATIWQGWFFASVRSIYTDVQELAADALIELYEVDATTLGGALSRFHAGTNQLKTNVIWQRNTYVAMPVEVAGFELTGKGKLPRPTMRMQNVDGLIGALVDTYHDLIGAKVTRKRTFKKYLDAVNFTSGANSTADPTAAFQDDVFFIHRKSSHTKFTIEFELTSSFDVQGVLLPRRQMMQHLCMWQYRSTECSYAGGAVADALDVPTTVLANDVCGKRVVSCTMRFGATAALPFGGFPGIGVVRQ